METILTELRALSARVEAGFADSNQRLDGLAARLGEMNGRLVTVETESRLQLAARMNAETRQVNAMKSHTAPLAPLPFNAAGHPWPADVEQPSAFMILALAGNANIPGTHDGNTWNNRRKRGRFLAQAVPGDIASDSEGEGENDDKARTRRLRVIEYPGGRFERVIASVQTL